MIAILVGILKSLILLVPAVICLARPDLIQWMVIDAGRKRGLGREWQETVLAEECTWGVRLCGAVLLLLGWAENKVEGQQEQDETPGYS